METKKQLRKDLNELTERINQLERRERLSEWERQNPPIFKFNDKVIVKVPQEDEYYERGYLHTKITGFKEYDGIVINNGHVIRYDDKPIYNFFYREYMVICDGIAGVKFYPEKQLSIKK